MFIQLNYKHQYPKILDSGYLSITVLEEQKLEM